MCRRNCAESRHRLEDTVQRCTESNLLRKLRERRHAVRGFDDAARAAATLRVVRQRRRIGLQRLRESRRIPPSARRIEAHVAAVVNARRTTAGNRRRLGRLHRVIGRAIGKVIADTTAAQNADRLPVVSDLTASTCA